MQEPQYTNIYYFYNICAIGGIETFFYQLAKKYQDYDLTIVYRNADPVQLARLKQYVRCVQFTGQKFTCKRAFFNFNTDIIDNVDAEEYILVIHGDYKDMMRRGQIHSTPGHYKINRYIGVSKLACKSFTELTGQPCELSYNPFEFEKPTKVLQLVSATRLTREKGKQRMEKLAAALDKAGIPYIWTVFTNDRFPINNPNVIYMTPRLDISGYVANADYLVQLSDNEGFCYSVVEALSAGVPVIVTPCPVFEELGLKNKENCYILPFDMSDIPIDDIYNHIPKVSYIPPTDSWDKFLLKGNSTYKEDKEKRFKVAATRAYEDYNLTDATLHRKPTPGEIWEVDYDRLQVLLGNNSKKVRFVTIVEDDDK